jgi:hypothetical protein
LYTTFLSGNNKKTLIFQRDLLDAHVFGTYSSLINSVAMKMKKYC